MLVSLCSDQMKDIARYILHLCHNRQPESYRRPTFPQLVELLSRAVFELFAWEEEDLKERDPLQIKTIGAPLETAKNLYLDLQMTYITNN